MKCPNCRFDNPEGHRFCGHCGQELTAATPTENDRPALDAERKRVTALFSDISGYTAMTSKLDPEEVKEITSRVFDGVREVVSKYEGFVERFAGDGVLALFGVPKAHEDDPIRAIHAAREIHELVESLSPRYEAKIGRSLSMHSGVNTGLAVTADVDPTKGTHGVTGDAINVAARLSDLAQAREILVGPDTHRACQSHFPFQPLAPAKVKGKSEPIPVFKVLSAKVSAPQARTGRQVSSEMVGRDSELDKLELQVMKAINGEGSVVNVIGEAGIGKSRLIAELKKREVMKRVTLLEGRAISIGKNLSFHPIIDLLKQWAGIAEDDSEARAFDKLEKAIRSVHPEETNEILPFVATLMGMKLTGKHAERVKGIEGEGLEKLILKNVRELVIKGSELRASVVIMEDLHWADTSSFELLGSLYRLAEKYRIAFINVFRPGYFDSDDGAVAKVGERLPVYYVEIQIQPLDKDNSEALINNMLEIKGLPYSLKTQIVERAGGNPFFIEEVVRSLIDEGAVVSIDGRFEVTDKIDSVVIPPTINDVLIARIDRLEEQTRELVKVASVIGRSFFDRIIKDVADSIGDVDDRLAYLKDVQLIRDRMRMQELEYLFKHALAQEAAYESTLIQQRKAIHLKVAQSIEKLFQDRLHEFYGMLAYHYGKGEDLEKAEEYLTKAGEEALRTSASNEALSYFQQALRLYQDKYGSAVDSEKSAQFEKNIGMAFYHKGQYADAVKYLDRALSRWGAGSSQKRIVVATRAVLDLLIIVADLYFPMRRSRKSLDTRARDVVELRFRRAHALIYVDTKRLLVELLRLARMSLQSDFANTPLGRQVWALMSVVFTWAGFSYKLNTRILARAQEVMDSNDVSEVITNRAMVTVNHLCAGTWQRIGDYDEALVKKALGIGEFWTVHPYIRFLAQAKAEQGYFDDLRFLIEELLYMTECFDHDLGRVNCHQLKTHLSIQTRQLYDVQVQTETGVSLTNQLKTTTIQVNLIGLKVMALILLNQVDEANMEVLQATELVAEQKVLPPHFAAPYLLGRFLTDIHLLKEAMRSNDRSNLMQSKMRAYQSGKASLRNSRKYAPFRTWIYQLMGQYYWLINKQGKAMKWWDKAMKEGERLGARPDLSRTYFEVGKHLLKPESKYKHLNGIDANGYLEKAGILFEEMGLERDLEDLERVRMGL
jgi:class 3 adenylate cyclase/tetratricopeptide (TPR) repeat protein